MRIKGLLAAGLLSQIAGRNQLFAEVKRLVSVGDREGAVLEVEIMGKDRFEGLVQVSAVFVGIAAVDGGEEGIVFGDGRPAGAGFHGKEKGMGITVVEEQEKRANQSNAIEIFHDTLGAMPVPSRR